MKSKTKKAKLNQGFMGDPTWMDYTSKSIQEPDEKFKALDKIIEFQHLKGNDGIRLPSVE